MSRLMSTVTRWSLPLFVIALASSGSSVAHATDSPGPPTPEQAMEPARNAAAFSDIPRDSAMNEYTAKNRKSSTREKGRPVQEGEVEPAHNTYIECGARPSMVRSGRLISAEGYSYCVNGPADLLYNKNCVDLWATGGYWTELSCSSWRSCATCSYIAGYFEARTCTPGRYYRPVSKMYAVHGNSFSRDYPGYYLQC